MVADLWKITPQRSSAIFQKDASEGDGIKTLNAEGEELERNRTLV